MPPAAPATAYGDTNIFVALFATPDHALHERALRLFRRVAAGELAIILTSVITAELCFVATRVLGWSRGQTADRLKGLLDADGLIVPEGELLRVALTEFGRSKRLAFADAYLAANALTAGPAAIATFDRALASTPGLRDVASEPTGSLFERGD
jgi:predicted nucleic acid-binding protein